MMDRRKLLSSRVHEGHVHLWDYYLGYTTSLNEKCSLPAEVSCNYLHSHVHGHGATFAPGSVHTLMWNSRKSQLHTLLPWGPEFWCICLQFPGYLPFPLCFSQLELTSGESGPLSFALITNTWPQRILCCFMWPCLLPSLNLWNYSNINFLSHY